MIHDNNAITKTGVVLKGKPRVHKEDPLAEFYEQAAQIGSDEVSERVTYLLFMNKRPILVLI
jgi:hypothetical protein